MKGGVLHLWIWERLSKALALLGQVLAAAALLDVVGGELETPAVYIQVDNRKFEARARVKRIA